MKHPARVLNKLDVLPAIKQAKNPAMKREPDIKAPKPQRMKPRIIIRK